MSLMSSENLALTNKMAQSAHNSAHEVVYSMHFVIASDSTIFQLDFIEICVCDSR